MKITLETLLGKGYDANGRRMIPGPSVPAKPVRGAKTPASAPKAVAKPARLKPGPSAPEQVMARHLGILKATKLIRGFSSQPKAFPLADDCKYTVDFMVDCFNGTFLCIETKGPYKREDSIIKLKWTAASWPEWLFVLAERTGSRTMGYRWRYTFRQGRGRIIGKERAQLLKRIGHLLP